jgi:hypothetical protein
MIRIWVIHYQALSAPVANRLYQPIMAKSIEHPPGHLPDWVARDDVGVHISHKNHSLGELTAHYWVFHNAPSTICGFCHYRRFFDFLDLFHGVGGLRNYVQKIAVYPLTLNLLNQICSEEAIPIIQKELERHEIIAYEPFTFDESVAKQFIRWSWREAWETFVSVLQTAAPDYSKSLSVFDTDQFLYPCLSFVTRWEVFSEFTQLWKEILFRLETVLPASDDPLHRRTPAFLAERLLHLFIRHHKYRVKTVPMLYLPSQEEFDRLRAEAILRDG